jgi:uncharacterized OB-fold protein
MSDLSYQRPRPTLSASNAPFWAALREHRLVLPRCGGCGATWLPIGPACPHCLGDRIEWYQALGLGRVTSWVVYHKLYDPSFADALPYLVAEVELVEGPRLTSTLQGIELSAVEAGMEVEIAFEDVAADLTLHRFRSRRRIADTCTDVS